MIETTQTLADFVSRYGPPMITMGCNEVQHHWYLDTYIILVERADGTNATSDLPHEDREPAWMRYLH